MAPRQGPTGAGKLCSLPRPLHPHSPELQQVRSLPELHSILEPPPLDDSLSGSNPPRTTTSLLAPVSPAVTTLEKKPSGKTNQPCRIRNITVRDPSPGKITFGCWLAGWLRLGSYLAGIQVSPSLLCAGPQTRCVTPGSSETPGLPEEARLCRCRRRSWKAEDWGPTPGGEPSAIGRQWPFADVCRNKLCNERRLSDPRFRSSRAAFSRLIPSRSFFFSPPPPPPSPTSSLYSPLLPLPLHSCCHPRRTSQKMCRWWLPSNTPVLLKLRMDSAQSGAP